MTETSVYVNMAVNSSSADFLDWPDLFDNSSLPLDCYSSALSISILTAFSIVNILLLLPLFILVLCLGCQRWRHQRATSTAAATTSHSDVFTYHTVVMEMISLVQCVLYCVGAYANLHKLTVYSIELFSTTWCVKVQFHMLTCVELYLAVVHPVTYLQRKNSSGVRIRNISIAVVWLICLVWFGLIVVLQSSAVITMILFFCVVAIALIVMSFCCIAVLCALKRPGPGDGGGDRDQYKRRAFHSIVTIMAVLCMSLGGMLACDALQASQLLQDTDGCIAISSAVWFSLPISLVLPLLFLQRAGKLLGCKR